MGVQFSKKTYQTLLRDTHVSHTHFCLGYKYELYMFNFVFIYLKYRVTILTTRWEKINDDLSQIVHYKIIVMDVIFFLCI